MGRALYRKYRSKNLGEIVGQPHVVTTLGNALKSGHIAHAYLLTGPRGTGKTSIARIIAHEVNGLEYSEDPHFDIIEIDAASNNGVEDVRALREKVQSAPTSARYKVYIIDEVHMLSKPAFNALLKTLEEPPEHVIFILATTDVHKVPETIISRTQRFTLQPVALPTVVKHLRTIAKAEGIKADDDALELIAEHGEGSFRDSISLLDQASTLGKTIARRDVEALLGRAPSALIADLTAAVTARDAGRIITVLDQLYAAGFQGSMLASQLSAGLYGYITHPDGTISAADALTLLRALIDVPAAARPNQLLEIVLLQYAVGQQNQNEVKSTEDKSPSQVKSGKPEPSEPVAPAESETVADESPEMSHESKDKSHETAASDHTNEAMDTPPEAPLPDPTENGDNTDKTPDQPQGEGHTDADELWHAVLQDVKKTHNTLYGIARMARPQFSDSRTLVLTLKFPFHQKRLAESRNTTILTKSVAAHRGQDTALRFVVANGGAGETPKKMDISNISNIFGGAELLE